MMRAYTSPLCELKSRLRQHDKAVELGELAHCPGAKGSADHSISFVP